MTIQSSRIKGDTTEYIVKNNGSQDVIFVCLYCIPRDKDGNIQFMSEASAAGVGEERIFPYIRRKIGPGKTDKEEYIEFKHDYPNATQEDIAVLMYGLADGTGVFFPERALRWFSSSEQKYINFPEARNTNCYPSDEVYEKCQTVDLGIEVYNGMLSWHAEYYGYHHIGDVVMSVKEDSIAAKAGLQTTDLIVAANGLTFEENPYTLEIGIAEMADTGKLTLTVERYGEEGTFEVELTKE